MHLSRMLDYLNADDSTSGVDELSKVPGIDPEIVRKTKYLHEFDQ